MLHPVIFCQVHKWQAVDVDAVRFAVALFVEPSFDNSGFVLHGFFRIESRSPGKADDAHALFVRDPESGILTLGQHCRVHSASYVCFGQIRCRCS